jgi:hypothetical protein
VRLDWARLTVRLVRFELIAVGGLVLAATVGAFIAAAWVDSLRPPAECLTYDAFGNSPPGCQFALDRWSSAKYGLGGLIGGLVVVLPLAAGLFLGVPIVARELERGTTRLAWSLAPSRLRWFLARLVPVLLVVTVLSFAAGAGADRIVLASEPGIDLANSFTAFGYHGILLAGRAVFIFAIAVAVGTVVARSLPSIILAGLVAGIGLIGGADVHDRILRAEAVPVDQAQILPGDKYIDQRFRLPDGTLVGWEYFGFDGNGPYDEQGNSRYPEVVMVVPGTRYGEVEAREMVALAGASLVAFGLAAFVIERRRPD